MVAATTTMGAFGEGVPQPHDLVDHPPLAHLDLAPERLAVHHGPDDATVPLTHGGDGDRVGCQPARDTPPVDDGAVDPLRGQVVPDAIEQSELAPELAPRAE